MAQNVGIGTTIPVARLHVTDSSVLFSAPGGIPVTPGSAPQQGAGRRMMWYPGKAAFRAGYTDGTHWDNNNIGGYSVAMGYSTTASGFTSTALGNFTVASEYGAIATGYLTNASGFISTSMGMGTNAKALGSLSIGTFNDDTDDPQPFTADPFDRIFQIGNGDGVTRSNVLTILRSGNAGIGIITPSATLDVIRGTATGGTAQFRGTQYLSHFNYSTNEDTYIRAGKDNGNVILNDIPGGKVGIGTVNPGSKLHVVSGSSGYGGGNFQGITLEGDGNTYFNLIAPDNSEGAILFGKASDIASGGIVYNNAGTPNSLEFRTNGNSTKMVVRQNGNVGIGTSNPNAPLGFPAALGKKITLYPGASGDVGMAVQANLFQIYSDNPNADIAFGYDQAGTLIERMRVKASGRVGIGTNNPGALLEVNGFTKLGSDAPSIKVKKITGTTAPTEGGYVAIGFGMDISKILSVSVLVFNTGPGYEHWYGPNTGGFGVNYYCYLSGTGLAITNRSGDSNGILSMPIKVLIVYEE